MPEVWFQGVASICIKWVSPGGLWVVPYRLTVVIKPQEFTLSMHEARVVSEKGLGVPALRALHAGSTPGSKTQEISPFPSLSLPTVSRLLICNKLHHQTIAAIRSHCP